MKKTTTRYEEKIKGIPCEIVHWTDEGFEKIESLSKGIWNSYIIIRKSDFPKLFNKFVLKPKGFRITPSSPIRYRYDYNKFEYYFNFHGGITYWEYLWNEKGKIWALKVGCDYAHAFDTEQDFTYEMIKKDLEESVDTLLTNLTNKNL